MSEVGRPTDLTEELTLKIRELVLEEKLYKEIQAELQISPNTWDTWVYKDYNGFRAKLIQWKREKLVKKAERNVDFLLDAEDERVKADMTKFTLETLGKDYYSKRQEMTGKDGEQLIPKPIYGGASVQGHEGNTEDIQP